MFPTDIVSQRLDITEYVERLGPSLTSTVVEDRVKATRLLSTTLKDLPSDHLNETQLNFITTFYCDRLKDHHSVVPHTLTGIVAIVHMLHVPEGAAGRILHAMFHNVPCQSQVRADREKIFDIVQTLADNKQTGESYDPNSLAFSQINQCSARICFVLNSTLLIIDFRFDNQNCWQWAVTLCTA